VTGLCGLFSMETPARQGLLGMTFLGDIEAQTRAEARRALENFREENGAKYPMALASSTATDAAHRVLRLFCRALAPPPDYEPDREQLRRRPAADPSDQGRWIEDRGPRHGLQAARVGLGAAATVQRPRARGRRPRRREVQGRHRGHRRQPQRRNDRREGRRVIILHCQIHNI
jgi:hypothetical protein